MSKRNETFFQNKFCLDLKDTNLNMKYIEQHLSPKKFIAYSVFLLSFVIINYNIPEDLYYKYENGIGLPKMERFLNGEEIFSLKREGNLNLYHEKIRILYEKTNNITNQVISDILQTSQKNRTKFENVKKINSLLLVIICIDFIFLLILTYKNWRNKYFFFVTSWILSFNNIIQIHILKYKIRQYLSDFLISFAIPYSHLLFLGFYVIYIDSYYISNFSSFTLGLFLVYFLEIGFEELKYSIFEYFFLFIIILVYGIMVYFYDRYQKTIFYINNYKNRSNNKNETPKQNSETFKKVKEKIKSNNDFEICDDLSIAILIFTNTNKNYKFIKKNKFYEHLINLTLNNKSLNDDHREGSIKNEQLDRIDQNNCLKSSFEKNENKLKKKDEKNLNNANISKSEKNSMLFSDYISILFFLQNIIFFNTNLFENVGVLTDNKNLLEEIQEEINKLIKIQNHKNDVDNLKENYQDFELNTLASKIVCFEKFFNEILKYINEAYLKITSINNQGENDSNSYSGSLFLWRIKKDFPKEEEKLKIFNNNLFSHEYYFDLYLKLDKKRNYYYFSLIDVTNTLKYSVSEIKKTSDLENFDKIRKIYYNLISHEMINPIINLYQLLDILKSNIKTNITSNENLKTEYLSNTFNLNGKNSGSNNKNNKNSNNLLKNSEDICSNHNFNFGYSFCSDHLNSDKSKNINQIKLNFINNLKNIIEINFTNKNLVSDIKNILNYIELFMKDMEIMTKIELEELIYVFIDTEDSSLNKSNKNSVSLLGYNQSCVNNLNSIHKNDNNKSNDKNKLNIGNTEITENNIIFIASSYRIENDNNDSSKLNFQNQFNKRTNEDSIFKIENINIGKEIIDNNITQKSQNLYCIKKVLSGKINDLPDYEDIFKDKKLIKNDIYSTNNNLSHKITDDENSVKNNTYDKTCNKKDYSKIQNINLEVEENSIYQVDRGINKNKNSPNKKKNSIFYKSESLLHKLNYEKKLYKFNSNEEKNSFVYDKKNKHPNSEKKKITINNKPSYDIFNNSRSNLIEILEKTIQKFDKKKSRLDISKNRIQKNDEYYLNLYKENSHQIPELSQVYTMKKITNFLKKNNEREVEEHKKFVNSNVQRPYSQQRYYKSLLEDSFIFDKKLSKFDMQNGKFLIEKFNLKKTIFSLVKIFTSKLSISNKKITFNVSYSEVVPLFIKTDSKLISQIIFNIFCNSIKNLHHGKIDIKVLKEKINENHINISHNEITNANNVRNFCDKEVLIIQINHPFLISNDKSLFNRARKTLLNTSGNKSMLSSQDREEKSFLNSSNMKNNINIVVDPNQSKKFSKANSINLLNNFNNKLINFPTLKNNVNPNPTNINISYTNNNSIFIMKILMNTFKNLLTKIGGEITYDVLNKNEICYKLILPQECLINEDIRNIPILKKQSAIHNLKTNLSTKLKNLNLMENIGIKLDEENLKNKNKTSKDLIEINNKIINEEKKIEKKKMNEYCLNVLNKNLTLKNQIFESPENNSKTITLNESNINLFELGKIKNDSEILKYKKKGNITNIEKNSMIKNLNNKKLNNESYENILIISPKKTEASKNFYEKILKNDNLILNKQELKPTFSPDKNKNFNIIDEMIINEKRNSAFSKNSYNSSQTNKIKEIINEYGEIIKNEFSSSKLEIYPINKPRKFSTNSNKSNTLIYTKELNINNLRKIIEEKNINITSAQAQNNSILTNATKDNVISLIVSNNNNTNPNNEILQSNIPDFKGIKDAKSKNNFVTSEAIMNSFFSKSNKSRNPNSIRDQAIQHNLTSSKSTNLINEINFNTHHLNVINNSNILNNMTNNSLFQINSNMDITSSDEDEVCAGNIDINKIINENLKSSQKIQGNNNINIQIIDNININNNINHINDNEINNSFDELKHGKKIKNTNNKKYPSKGDLNRKNSICKCKEIKFRNKDYNIKILIVEDEKFIRSSQKNLIIKHLNRINPKLEVLVEECEDGIECIYKIYRGLKSGIKYDFILTDETMDFMNGTMMTYIIRGLVDKGVFYDINIHLITSYETNSTILLANDLFNSMFTKPLNNIYLDAILSEYLQ